MGLGYSTECVPKVNIKSITVKRTKVTEDSVASQSVNVSLSDLSPFDVILKDMGENDKCSCDIVLESGDKDNLYTVTGEKRIMKLRRDIYNITSIKCADDDKYHYELDLHLRNCNFPFYQVKCDIKTLENILNTCSDDFAVTLRVIDVVEEGIDERREGMKDVVGATPQAIFLMIAKGNKAKHINKIFH